MYLSSVKVVICFLCVVVNSSTESEGVGCTDSR